MIFYVVCCSTLVVLAPNRSAAADFTQPDPLEPDVAEASQEAVQSMAAIKIPDGWEIGLFAAEPDVANVVAFDIDHRGRIFVCESYRQNRGVTDNRGHDDTWLLADLAAQTVQDRIDYHKRLLGEAAITYAQHDDRIRRLDDSDGDGIADRSYVVANGFNRLEEGTGAGVLVRGHDIYFTCIPKLWKLVDKDDNGDAEERISLYDGFGVRVAFRGHDLHGLIVGPDGRLYFSIGDRGYHVTTDDGTLLANPESGAVFRCELDGSGLEVFASGMRNPQELAFNDLGDLFTVDNNSDSGDLARIVHILQGGDSGWRMQYQYLPDRGPFNREKIWEPFHSEQPAFLVPPITNFADGPSGLAFYPGTGFGDQLKDTFLLCDFRGSASASGIRSFKLEPDGAFYRLAADASPIESTLATDVAFGPDGALYVSDWVATWDGVGKGRIYRITDPQHRDSTVVREVRALLAGDWTERGTADLADDLRHPDRRIRFEAQWELARRAELKALLELSADAETESIARLHAIWGADQIARLDESKRPVLFEAIHPLLLDNDATVRAAAAKVAGERGDRQSVPRLRELLLDDSPRVRYFSTLSLGQLGDQESLASVVALLEQNNNSDPAIRHAGVMYLSSFNDPSLIAGLADHANESVRRAAVVALRRLKSGELTRFLEDTSPLVVAEAARAIHDVPIPVGISALAELVDRPTDDNELMRRVLNANYRLGTPEAAAKIAEYAGRIVSPAEMRLEALDMLASWQNPDPRDRVINAFRPLESRNPAAAAAAIEAHIESLMTSEDAVREKAIDTAALLGVKEIAPQLTLRVADFETPIIIRAASLSALGKLEPQQAVAIARDLDLNPATELAQSALTILGNSDVDASLTKIISATKSSSLSMRQLAWSILSRINRDETNRVIAAGIESYLSGELPADVQLDVIEAAAERLDKPLQERLAAHQKSVAESDPLGAWLPALEGGDAESGRKLFIGKTQLSCVRCHKVRETGGEVGPDLTSIASGKDRRYLLESICLPNATIAKGFETAVIADDSGQVFTGIVKSETQDMVILVQSDGSQQQIATETIDARRTGTSAMPSDLIKSMDLRELRDIVAYLASLKG